MRLLILLCFLLELLCVAEGVKCMRHGGKHVDENDYCVISFKFCEFYIASSDKDSKEEDTKGAKQLDKECFFKDFAVTYEDNKVVCYCNSKELCHLDYSLKKLMGFLETGGSFNRTECEAKIGPLPDASKIEAPNKVICSDGVLVHYEKGFTDLSSLAKKPQYGCGIAFRMSGYEVCHVSVYAAADLKTNMGKCRYESEVGVEVSCSCDDHDQCNQDIARFLPLIEQVKLPEGQSENRKKCMVKWKQTPGGKTGGETGTTSIAFQAIPILVFHLIFM